MEFNYDEAVGLTEVIISKEKDVCAKCPPKIRGICPLLMGIIQNFVYPCANSIEMSSCCMFDELDRIDKARRRRIKKKKDLT